jgi:hypothetical protein
METAAIWGMLVKALLPYGSVENLHSSKYGISALWQYRLRDPKAVEKRPLKAGGGDEEARRTKAF